MHFECGDIFACYGSDWISRAITVQTANPFAPAGLRLGPSHVAMCVSYGEECLWAESTTMCPHPCLFAHEKVSGCQAHAPEARIEDYLYHGGHVEVYRLSEIDRLSKPERSILWSIMIDYFVRNGIGYDVGGALVSSGRCLPRLSMFRARLDEVFCSELIAAVLMRLGRMNRSNPSRYNPARLLRELIRTGTYSRAFGVYDWPYDMPDIVAFTHSPPLTMNV